MCSSDLQGEVVAMIGANGAGKTTLLNAVCGMHAPRRGEVIFQGQRITRTPPEGIVRLGMSHVPERRQLFHTMSVLDNLMLGTYHRARKASKAEIQQDLDTSFDLFPRLKERQKQRASTLSGGEQQMLAIARALMARPKLLLLDEPSLGLAPLLVKEIMRVIEQMRQRSLTVLLVEQNAKAALSIADRGYVMETGRIVIEGTAAQLQADQQIQAAYLGKGYKPIEPGVSTGG